MFDFRLVSPLSCWPLLLAPSTEEAPTEAMALTAVVPTPRAATPKDTEAAPTDMEVAHTDMANRLSLTRAFTVRLESKPTVSPATDTEVPATVSRVVPATATEVPATVTDRVVPATASRVVPATVTEVPATVTVRVVPATATAPATRRRNPFSFLPSSCCDHLSYFSFFTSLAY